MRCLLVLAFLCAGCAKPAGPGAEPAPVETRVVRDPVSGASLPRVVLPDRPDVERRVNAGLDSLSASLRCEDGGPNTADTSYDVRSAVAFAGADVLSVSVHAAYVCGGPYPTNDANLSVTYDLTNGRAVPFEALWRDYDADRDALLGLFSSTLQVGPFGTDPDSDCREVLTPERLADHGLAYVLSEEGLAVQPEFPHVIEACATEVTIPYGSVRAFAADGGVLARATDAAVDRSP